MARLDNLSENKLVTTVTQLAQEWDEFQGRQRTSGQSGVLSYATVNPSTWDLTGTIGSDSDTSSRTTNFTVTFTGDGSQSPIIANLSFVVYANGTDAAHQLTAVNGTYSDGTRFASLNYNPLQELQTTYTQTFYLITQKAITYYIKAYAVGSCRGTLTVTSP